MTGVEEIISIVLCKNVIIVVEIMSSVWRE